MSSSFAYRHNRPPPCPLPKMKWLQAWQSPGRLTSPSGEQTLFVHLPVPSRSDAPPLSETALVLESL
jgi:hypothetical protein